MKRKKALIILLSLTTLLVLLTIFKQWILALLICILLPNCHLI